MNEALQFLTGWPLYSIPAFLFLITVVVFFHELGHFSVARLFKVKVETFSIGFGRPLLSWTDRKGTKWKVSWLPLGGFVKFFGDADGASTPDRAAAARMTAEERAVAFPFKPLWQRALIVVAGPAANFVLALVVLSGLYMTYGHAIEAPAVIANVLPHSAAADAGIRPGDRIVSLDGTTVDTFDKMAQIVALSAGQRLPIVIERGGKQISLFVTPREVQDRDRFGNRVRVGRLGVSGKAIAGFTRLGPIQAVGAACEEIGDIVSVSFRARNQLLRGNTTQLAGPVGIAKLAGQIAAVSFVALIQVIALLSVSIGLVNLFPIPLLDGGHLLYYAIEGVLGRPLGERAQDVGFRVGLAVVAGIFILATWNDLLNLF